MKNNQTISAQIIMPAELHSAQISTFLSGLAVWNQAHAQTIEELYWGYCRDRDREVSVPGLISFSSYMFFECKAGFDLCHRLQAERKADMTISPGGQNHQPAPSTRGENN